MKGNRALFDAVTNIDEDLIAEAGAPRSLSFPKNIKRIATIAAVFLLIFGMLPFLNIQKTPAPIFSVYVYAQGMDAVELCPDGEKIELSSEDEQKFKELYDAYMDDLFDLLVAPPGSAFAPDFIIRISFEKGARDFLLNWKSEYRFQVLVNGEVLLEGDDAHGRIEHGDSQGPFSKDVVEGVLYLEDDDVDYQIAGAISDPVELQFIVMTKYGTVIQQYDVLVMPKGDNEIQEIKLIYAFVDGECVIEKDE